MRIILIGAPGTGKGTQGKFIAEKYKIPQIATGDILRQTIDLKTKIGIKIQDVIKKGQLVSNQIVCNLITKRLQNKDCMHGFVLDGFPRTLKQAYYLSQIRLKIDYVLELIVPYQSILERISGRRIHAQSGRIYHIKFNPPKNNDKDDFTGQSLIVREDDKIESIKKRLEEYEKINHHLIKYYMNEQKIGNIKFFRIKGTDSVTIIHKKIEQILKL